MRVTTAEKRHRLISAVLGEDLAKYSSYLSHSLPYSCLYHYHNMSSGDAAFLISAGGTSNTIGRKVKSCDVTQYNFSHLRLVGGWLSDQPWTHPLIITLVSLIAGIVPSFVLPWYR